MDNYLATTRFLFDLLDDIDMVDDMARKNDAGYRQMVRDIVARRFEVAITNGDEVTFLVEVPVDAEVSNGNVAKV